MESVNWIDILFSDELEATKGGIWVYDASTEEFIWVDSHDFEPEK